MAITFGKERTQIAHPVEFEYEFVSKKTGQTVTKRSGRYCTKTAAEIEDFKAWIEKNNYKLIMLKVGKPFVQQVSDVYF